MVHLLTESLSSFHGYQGSRPKWTPVHPPTPPQKKIGKPWLKLEDKTMGSPAMFFWTWGLNNMPYNTRSTHMRNYLLWRFCMCECFSSTSQICLTAFSRSIRFDVIIDSVGGDTEQWAMGLLKSWSGAKYVTLVTPLLLNTDSHGVLDGIFHAGFTLQSKAIQVKKLDFSTKSHIAVVKDYTAVYCPKCICLPDGFNRYHYACFLFYVNPFERDISQEAMCLGVDHRCFPNWNEILPPRCKGRTALCEGFNPVQGSFCCFISIQLNHHCNYLFWCYLWYLSCGPRSCFSWILLNKTMRLCSSLLWPLSVTLWSLFGITILSLLLLSCT